MDRGKLQNDNDDDGRMSNLKIPQEPVQTAKYRRSRGGELYKH